MASLIGSHMTIIIKNLFQKWIFGHCHSDHSFPESNLCIFDSIPDPNGRLGANTAFIM